MRETRNAHPETGCPARIFETQGKVKEPEPSGPVALSCRRLFSRTHADRASVWGDDQATFSVAVRSEVLISAEESLTNSSVFRPARIAALHPSNSLSIVL